MLRVFWLNSILLYASWPQGKTLRCSLSETKHRLFVGNVPKSWTEDEFRKVIEEVGPGLDSIELIKVGFQIEFSLDHIIRLDGCKCLPCEQHCFGYFRILKIQAEIVALLLFCITIMLVLIIQGRKCQVWISSWMAIPRLSPGLIQRVRLIMLLLLRWMLM